VKQGVYHIVALPFKAKSIVRQKQNYENSNISPWKNIILKKNPVYCLQSYVRLRPKSPLDERQIMEEELSSGIGSMLQTKETKIIQDIITL
jgi:hypothetical protein